MGFAAVTLALVVVVVGYPMFVDWRLTTETGSASLTSAAQLAASDEGRFSAVLAGPALFATSPVFGIGFGQYKYLSGPFIDSSSGLVAHNWYGTVLAEQGLLGIGLWVLMLFAVAVRIRSLPPRPRLIGCATFGALTVGCMFLEPPTSFQTSVLPALVLTAALVADWTARTGLTTASNGQRLHPVRPPVWTRPPAARSSPGSSRPSARTAPAAPGSPDDPSPEMTAAEVAAAHEQAGSARDGTDRPLPAPSLATEEPAEPGYTALTSADRDDSPVVAPTSGGPVALVGAQAPLTRPTGSPRVISASRPLRVALLTPSLHPGGAERQMLILAAALPRATFEIRFLVLWERGALADEAEALGLPVHVLGLSREMCRVFSPRCLESALGAVRAYVRLTRRVDIVDAWLVPAYTFAGIVQPLARVPVLMAGRRSTADVRRTRTSYRGTAEAFAMRPMKAVVANSQAVANDAISREHLDRSRMHVIRNAVVPAQTTIAERQSLRHAWGFALEDVVVGCVGNYKHGKGQELLLEVASDLHDRCPQVRFVFVGDGVLRGWLEDDIRRRGLESIVVLHSGEQDARRVYGAFDIAVQASDSEGMPNAVLEAAAAGLPTVATAVGGTSEIITSGKEGLLVRKGDRRGLGEAIGTLAQDADLRRRLGGEALERSRQFSPAKLANDAGSLYLRLASGQTSRSR